MKEQKVRVFFGRMLFIIGDDIYDVELFRSSKKLKKDRAYIHDSLVYPYHGKMDKHKKEDLLPGIYINSDDNYEFIEPSKNEKFLYDIDRISDLGIETINNKIKLHEDYFIKPSDIEIINNNAEMYLPTIKEDDDFLKIGIKKTIIDKHINLKNYKDKFTNPYALNNLKSGLNKETKMTVPNYLTWSEILDFDWVLRISDNGKDKLNPLSEDIIISSDDFK